MVCAGEDGREGPESQTLALLVVLGEAAARHLSEMQHRRLHLQLESAF